MVRKLLIGVLVGAVLTPVGLALSNTGGKGTVRGGTQQHCSYYSRKAHAAGSQDADQVERGRLPLAPDDQVDRRLRGEDVPRVVGRVDAPVDCDHRGEARLDRPQGLQADGVRGGRPGVPGHDHVRPPTPDLAHDTDRTVEQALTLWGRLDRPNVMIKVPGTEEGIPAIEELTAAGVNVNVTLLFSVSRYEQAATAYVAGLERRLDAGEPIDIDYLVEQLP